MLSSTTKIIKQKTPLRARTDIHQVMLRAFFIPQHARQSVVSRANSAAFLNCRNCMVGSASLEAPRVFQQMSSRYRLWDPGHCQQKILRCETKPLPQIQGGVT